MRIMKKPWGSGRLWTEFQFSIGDALERELGDCIKHFTHS